MIFSEEFDIALSLIIDNDMRNRGNIINLIKSIPLELISKINKILKDRAITLLIFEILYSQD